MPSFKEATYDQQSLARYADLFLSCFPNSSHLTPNYLKWLYVDNPYGRVVGVDAIEGDTLAAHYACVPARIRLFGQNVNALLSLNTATHPDYRGKGLFTKLAEETYRIAGERLFSAVFGVANANSTPGFIRKLGFQLVSPLEARVGVGRQLETDWDRVDKRAAFRRLWDPAQLAWRVRNPKNPVSIVNRGEGHIGLYARTDRKGIVVWGESQVDIPSCGSPPPSIMTPRLYLGLNPCGCVKRRVSFSIPDRFRPSPLNFIIRMLNNESPLEKDQVSFSFIDFDAY